MKKYKFTLTNPTNNKTIVIEADSKAEAMNIFKEDPTKYDKEFYNEEVFEVMKEFRKEASPYITCEPPYND